MQCRKHDICAAQGFDLSVADCDVILIKRSGGIGSWWELMDLLAASNICNSTQPRYFTSGLWKCYSSPRALHGISEAILHIGLLQVLQNSAARLITGARIDGSTLKCSSVLFCSASNASSGTRMSPSPSTGAYNTYHISVAAAIFHGGNSSVE